MALIPLTDIPERTVQPRTNGLTMIMDKGLSINEVESLIAIGKPHIDVVKLGFGTSYVTPNLDKKIQTYLDAGIALYFGGTLFEAYLMRGQLEDYITSLKSFGMTHVEVSDGSISISHNEKCKHIERFTQEGFTVFSEVGSKDAANVMAPYKWLNQMQSELNAGSTHVIAEAREAGNIGIYRGSGEVREGLIEEILTKIPAEKIIWEAPQKAQQLFFLNLLGCNVNLGNISPNEIISLEAMRIGLRGDTLNLYFNK
jgi:phosphosulfolactate synthase